MWFYRDPVYSEADNKKCLLEYSQALRMASTAVFDVVSSTNAPDWILKMRDLVITKLAQPIFGLVAGLYFYG